MIVNCTRQELAVRPSPGVPRNFIASPGCLADPHVVTTINRLILSNGEKISLRPTNKDSYHKHRKNETDKMLWERGYILIRKGEVIQRRIFCHKDKKGLVAATIAGDGVITHFGTKVPALRLLVLSDLHLPYGDVELLGKLRDSAEPFFQVIFNGDIFDCRSFNPHNSYEASHTDLQRELCQCKMSLRHIVDLLSATQQARGGLAPEMKFLWGNHEDFVRRFSQQYPQFASHFRGLFNDILKKHGSVVTEDHQSWFQLTPHTVIHHGSADIFGAGGNNLEKTARTFGTQAVIGHTHSPAIRFGVYRTGCLCKLAQGYNNAGMSNWAYGAAIIYASESHDFIELRNIL
jgi:predicted phosphodiesterase